MKANNGHPLQRQIKNQFTTRHFKFILYVCMIFLLTNGCSQKPILSDVSVSPETITPNADGDTDIAKIEFLLNANAMVSIVLSDINNNLYTFRSPTKLSVSEKPYTVLFSGVVDGFLTKDETSLDYGIEKRVLPDGAYTWNILAEAQDGEYASAQGSLRIQNAEKSLPGIHGFGRNDSSEAG